jgi:selenocysteine-specific elongation factor
MLGTAGHVDHGKTALVKLLTGCDTDTLPAEKARGLTIELGFAPCQMADQRIVGVVDVPGHVDFIRNMAAGAQGIDVVIFVIAADDGIMPQTREHLDILTLMGVRRGLVALTKIDLVEDELREMVVEEVRKFLGGTFLADAPICPISNITGEGYEGLFAALNAAVEAAEPRQAEGLFRLGIERSFHVKGFGTVASGIPSSGAVRVGDRLHVMPGGQVARVRGMEVYGEPAEIARAGECAALNLVDVDVEHLLRGRVLCESDAFAAVSDLEAELTILKTVPQPLKDYFEAHVHIGTAEVMADVALMEKSEILPGEPQLVQLRLHEPICPAVGERFVVRASVARLAGGRVTTVGGGRVLGASGVRLRRRRPWTIQTLSDRRAALGKPAAWAAQCLREAPGTMTADALARAAQLPAAKVAELLAALVADGTAVELAAGQYVHREAVARSAEAIAAAVKAFHEANPMRLGIDESALGRAVHEAETVRLGIEHPAASAAPSGPAAGPAGKGPLFDAALSKLLADGKLHRDGAVIAATGRTGGMSLADRQLLQQVEKILRDAHLEPPLPEAIAATLREPLDRIDNLIRLLVDAGLVLRLDRKVAMHRDAVDAARKVVLELFAKANTFETVQFRDALNVSRKFAVPLLDYFDTARWTVRAGSLRRPGAKAKEALGKH